jgi:CRISPR-associated protein Cas6
MNELVPSAVDDYVDLQFELRGQTVPLDYADVLWSAVRNVLPWLETDALAGIHPLSGLSPSADAGEWYLARRSRLTLRLARDRVPAAQTLVGTSLRLAGEAVEVGPAHVRDLMHASVLNAKFVTIGNAGDAPIAEDEFQAACIEEFAAMGLTPRMLFGKPQRASTRDGVLTGFSLLLHELSAEAALLLQHRGIGRERKRGCGIFIPHKSIVAVGTLE